MNDAQRIDFQGRLARLRTRMRERGLAGLYLTAGANMRYFVGWSTYSGGWPIWLSALVIPAEGAPALLMSKMHHDIFLMTDSWLKDGDVRVHRDGDVPTGDLAAVLKDKGLSGQRVGVEDSMWYADYEMLRAADPTIGVERATALLDGLRQVKDDAEIEAVRKANEITDLGYAKAVQVIREGVPECDAAMQIVQAMVSAGSGTMQIGGTFRTLLRRRFQRGDIIDVDMGARWQGYNTDTARNVFVGKPGRDAERAYQVTLEAFNETLNLIRPGVPLQDIHRFAAGYMKKHGYDQVWKIGHGVGAREGHEAPLVQDGETQLTEPGMVFVVDPGCFISGQVRDTPIHIEDCILVTPTGYENLTKFRRDLIVV